MEIQLTSQKRDSKASEPDSPMIKEVDDFPTFDEAFDKESLLKFFKEQDSASLQSLFSPQKDISTVDETRSLAEERDIQLSPNNQNLSRSHNQTPINKSNLSFSFNFNSNPKIFEVKRLARGNSNLSPQSGTSASTQASSGSPINPSPIKSSDFYLLGSQNPTFPTSKAPHYSQEETTLQRLIREKKVFRIIRNQKPVTTKRSSKRRASMPLDEFHPSPKQINSQSSYQVNFYNSPPFLPRSASQPQNTQPFSDISNYFGNIPNNTTQNPQNIFNMYPLQNVNQPYDNVNYLFNSSKY